MKRTIGRVALLLVISMLIGLVAGCDKPTTTATTAATTKSGATTAAGTTAATTAASNLNAPGQLPVVKSKETIRIVISQSPYILSYEYGENKFTTWLQDRTGVVVDFIKYPEADATTKLNLELSTKGDLGDMINILMDRAMLVTYGGQGVLAPLNDMIKTYGFKMKEMMNAFPGSYEAVTAPDGNIYALPQGSLVGIYPNSYAERFWIQSSFLAKYGKGMPTTTDQMYDFMKWAKTSDPNGNGKADEVGWTGAEKTTVWYARPTYFLMNAFTLQSYQANMDGYYQKDDVIHFAPVETGYRDGLKFLAKLMKEGLMDTNYVNNDEATMKTLVALNGGDTVATISCGGMHNAASTNDIKNKYEIVPPLKGPTGLVNSFYDHYAAGVIPSKATIPMKSTKKEVVMAWMDSNYDQEVAFRGRYGEKGVDWETPAAGTVAVDGGPAMYKDIKSQWNVQTKSHWFTSSPANWGRYGSMTAAPLPALGADGKKNYDLEDVLYKAARLYEKTVIPCAVPNFFFDQATATKANTWKIAINDLSRNAITEFIFGTRDINNDTVWADYITQVNKAGLTDFLKVMQSAYDADWKGTLPKTYTVKPQRT